MRIEFTYKYIKFFNYSYTNKITFIHCKIQHRANIQNRIAVAELVKHRKAVKSRYRSYIDSIRFKIAKDCKIVEHANYHTYHINWMEMKYLKTMFVVFQPKRSTQCSILYIKKKIVPHFLSSYCERKNCDLDQYLFPTISDLNGT